MAIPEIQLYHVRDVTAALLCQLGIREGTWKLCVEMGTQVSDLPLWGQEMLPGMVVALRRVGVCRCAPEHPLAVDAAYAYPLERDDWDDALKDLEE